MPERVEHAVREMTPFAASSPALVDACTVALISPIPMSATCATGSGRRRTAA